MIVGTAGHIDHGKTTLVRALTGVDTDRLPEEKRRGVSIELGYAFADLPGGHRIGFVDVPGHERLVHTMLSGATGIDYALLLIAADDGVMPQTREHLAVLSLLGMARGAAVITKIDRVAPERIEAVTAQVQALLAPTPLGGAAVVPVSAHTGDGLDVLRARLADAAVATPEHRNAQARFRLAIDRSFTLDGVGTVVTGTVHAGQVAIGDELVLGAATRRARVRSLHAQNRAVAIARAGERCAVGLVGIDRDDVERGAWLTAPDVALVTDRIDVDLTVWSAESRPLRSGTPVHVHLGAAAATGTVAILAPDEIAPGASGRAQLVLRTPIGAWHGDRVVLRDASASRTLAGGSVLDPFAPTRYRRTALRLAELDALARSDPAERLVGLVARAPQGVDLVRYRCAQGRDAPVVLPEGALRAAEASSDWVIGASQVDDARRRVLEALAAFHAAHAEELGPDAARLRRLAVPRLADTPWRAVLAAMRSAGDVALQGAFVHRPEHGVRLSAAEQRMAERIVPRMARDGFEGSWVRDLARDGGEPEIHVRVTLARLARRGELHQVVKDLYYPPPAMARLAAIARDTGRSGEVTAAAFRDATGLGRKRAIQILEYLDRIGVLRRVGDVHKVRTDATVFTEAQR